MALRVFHKDTPRRSIALVSPSHALIFQYSRPEQSLTTRSATTQCMVEFVEIDRVDLAEYKPLKHGYVYGTLGLINIETDLFVCVITHSSLVATVRANEHVQRILAVEFYCLNRTDFDYVSEYGHDNDFGDTLEHLEYKEGVGEHPCLGLKKAISDGSFYYSVDFDLTNRLQDRFSEESAFDINSLDYGFLWNSYMIQPLVEFRSRLTEGAKQALDASNILTSAIRGFVSTITIPASSSPIRAEKSRLPSNLTVISRLSCLRAGTRFNSRGIDDDGNAANFVETETVYNFPSGLCFSYAQIRGSVPIFWEQSTGLLPQQQKIQITRSLEATQPAFDRHFENLNLKYSNVHVLNLLSKSRAGEIELTERYNQHIRASPLNKRSNVTTDGRHHDLLQSTEFDFHAETQGVGYDAARTVLPYVRDRAEGFAYFLADRIDDNAPNKAHQGYKVVAILLQEGVFRTNCLDCLDRTNLVQTIISETALKSFLAHRNETALSDFWMRHSTLWADNGDALSKIYAGTGALKSSFTRHGKMSLAGAIADARKSATRLYINNFADKGRQNVIDTMLGRLVTQVPVKLFDPLNDWAAAELARRSAEYTTLDQISIWVGTFNLNGKGRGIKEDLSAWLRPKLANDQAMPDLVAVGFQEIVELSPQQIMSTDPARKLDWELAVAKTLNDHAKRAGFEEYVLLRSGQLVGAALLVFAKSHCLSLIKNVEGSVKKTGLSGMAGNKGAVAIRLDFATTRICFVTAHLAAGFANYDERNRDYQTIVHGLRFQRNRTIDDHDSVIWSGDFNYRIGLDNERVRRCIATEDLATLYHNDQLNIQMQAGYAFPFYQESKVNFLPTYKYNNGTDDYDTSEKARIPAWCDRILWKGENLEQLAYTTAPLRFSDHRPVYALFHCTVKVEDEKKKESLSRAIYNQRRSSIGSSFVDVGHADGEDDDDIEIIEESVAPGLPPASTDKQKWWLQDGQPARSNVADQHAGYKPNPNRPANPFSPTSESDWILVDDRQVPKPLPGAVPSKQSTNSQPNMAQISRSSSNASSIASSTRKVPPLVPRKPIELSNVVAPALPQRSKTVIEPDRSSTFNQVRSADVPVSLPRRPLQTVPQEALSPSANTLLLDTLDDEQISNIPALQPKRSNP